jgi:hypothetical protein
LQKGKAEGQRVSKNEKDRKHCYGFECGEDYVRKNAGGLGAESSPLANSQQRNGDFCPVDGKN